MNKKSINPFSNQQSASSNGRRIKALGLVLAAAMLMAALGGCMGLAETGPSQTDAAETTTIPTQTTTATTAAPTPEPTTEPAPAPPSAEAPVVALTFDDGPSLRDTGPLLDLLAAEEVTATFFVLGNQIDLGREDIVLRAWQEGHEIANHTYSHQILSGLSAEAIRDELESTNSMIESIIGSRPTIMRPPTGAYDQNVEDITREMGLAIVNWDWISCPEDWNHHDNPEYIANHVVENAMNGHIVLLHDTNEATMASMPDMIAGLKARGFRFMTVSELLAWQGDGHPQPGEVYFSYAAE